MSDIKILNGDCREMLKTLPEKSIHCCVTSPPYYGLRDYGVDGQIGLEQTPEEYVNELVGVFKEVKSVLRDDGTVWLNLGDSYCSAPPGNKTLGVSSRSGLHGVNNSSGKYRETLAAGHATKKDTSKICGLKLKDLIGIPWMVAFALRADGWYLRQDIIWSKNNPMPESVRDRCTKSHEYVFLLSKSKKYFYDNDAVKEPLARPDEGKRKTPAVFGGKDKFEQAKEQSRLHSGNPYTGTLDGMRNKRDVWAVATKPYKGAHFATFNLDLIDPCLKAGTSEKGVCSKCGKPWVRIIEKETLPHDGDTETAYEKGSTANRLALLRQAARERGEEYTNKTVTVGWKPSCSCEESEPIPATVLDPFGGSGTVGQWCKLNGRSAILIELNPAYIPLIEERINTIPKVPKPKKEKKEDTVQEEDYTGLSIDECEEMLTEEEMSEYYDILIESPCDALEAVKRAYWLGKGVRV